MPNLMVKATPLPNIRGRIRYATSPKKQENLLATYDGAAELLEGQYWKRLAEECRIAYEQFGDKSKKCCEGRELMVILSNALLERMSPEKIVKTIAEEVKEKLGLDCFVALHFNKTKKSLHAHIIFGERELLQEPVVKTAERNLFYNAEGKRCYKKSEILDENKQLLPGCKIIKKGEVCEQRYFGSVNPQYSYQSWLKDVKTNVILPMRNGKLKGDVEITEYNKASGKLPQQPIPKGTSESKAIRIVKCNEMVVRFNRYVDSGTISLEDALAYQKKIMGAKDRNAALNNVLWEIRRPKNKKTVRLKTDWKIQNMVDAVRLAEKEETKDFNEILKRRGQELGEAKRKYALVQENGDFEAIMEAAKELNEATERYKKAARIKETMQLQNERIDLGDR